MRINLNVNNKFYLDSINSYKFIFILKNNVCNSKDIDLLKSSISNINSKLVFMRNNIIRFLINGYTEKGINLNINGKVMCILCNDPLLTMSSLNTIKISNKKCLGIFSIITFNKEVDKTKIMQIYEYKNRVEAKKEIIRYFSYKNYEIILKLKSVYTNIIMLIKKLHDNRK